MAKIEKDREKVRERGAIPIALHKGVRRESTSLQIFEHLYYKRYFRNVDSGLLDIEREALQDSLGSQRESENL